MTEQKSNARMADSPDEELVDVVEGLIDVVSYSDGGGLVRAAGVPVTGRKRVATFIAAVSAWVLEGRDA